MQEDNIKQQVVLLFYAEKSEKAPTSCTKCEFSIPSLLKFAFILLDGAAGVNEKAYVKIHHLATVPVWSYYIRSLVLCNYLVPVLPDRVDFNFS
jgi:hypothetical protein